MTQLVGMAPLLYCNACGREVEISRSMGAKYAVCSAECVREMRWRETLSILRKPYRLDPESELAAMAKRLDQP